MDSPRHSTAAVVAFVTSLSEIFDVRIVQLDADCKIVLLLARDPEAYEAAAVDVVRLHSDSAARITACRGCSLMRFTPSFKTICS